MIQAQLLSTKGEYLEAIVEIAGKRYCVMDEISSDEEEKPSSTKVFSVEFNCLVDGDDSWEDMFQANPEKKKGLEQLQGWKYRAFGKIVGINPVKVDCGLFIEEDVLQTTDPKVIGEYIGFTINRLGVCLP